MLATRALPFFALSMCLVISIHSSAGLVFDMDTETKCVTEEIGANTLAVGEFSGFLKADGRETTFVRVKVSDPQNKDVYNEKDLSKGRFAFKTSSPGDYRACFTVHSVGDAHATGIHLEWKTGVAASNWDDIAKREDLDDMATELRMLEQVVKEIHDEMLFFRQREEEMRDLNEATNDRVAWYSIASLVMCIALGGWQLWHLQHFFRRKKLL